MSSRMSSHILCSTTRMSLKSSRRSKPQRRTMRRKRQMKSRLKSISHHSNTWISTKIQPCLISHTRSILPGLIKHQQLMILQLKHHLVQALGTVKTELTKMMAIPQCFQRSHQFRQTRVSMRKCTAITTRRR